MFKKKLLNKAIMATVLGGMMLAPSFALASDWDMQTMCTVGTSTSFVSATSANNKIYLNTTTGHYTFGGTKQMSTAQFNLYYGYDKETGEVLGNAVAPVQAKGKATMVNPKIYFTIKASDLPDNYTVPELESIFSKLLEKYVDIFDDSQYFYNQCRLQVVDDAGNQLYAAGFKTEKDGSDKVVPVYSAINTLNLYDKVAIGDTGNRAYILGTDSDQNEVALGKSDVVNSTTNFKFATDEPSEGIVYGIYNDKKGKICASGYQLNMNSGTNSAPDNSIGIYTGNESGPVGEVKVNFDYVISITAGMNGVEAGKNGKITVSGNEAGGSGGMTVQSVKSGYAAYAHDGGEITLEHSGSGQFTLAERYSESLPPAVLRAENGGKINVKNYSSGSVVVQTGVGGTAVTAKALTDATGVIDIGMNGSSGTLKVNADGNVNITLAGGNTWEGTAAGNTTLTGGNKSMWKYASTDAQHLAAFTGAKGDGYNAFVTMAGGNVAIDKYAGNGLFFVSDSVGTITINSADTFTTSGEANPLLDNITKDTLYFDSANDGGKIIPAGYENVPSVGETANSVITLATTTSLTDNGEIKNLLTGLADKLVYTGAAGGETNLDVRMAVVDSTAVNANITKFAVVSFDAMGNKTVGELQTPVAADGLHVQILGGGETGSVYTAYTTKDGDNNNVYTFDKDLIINRYAKTQIDGVKQTDIGCQFWSPIFGAFKEGENFATVVQNPSAAGEVNYTVDMQGHKLTAKNFYETGRNSANDRATIVTLAREGSITFNNVAGMDLEATADLYYTAAINVTEYSPSNIPVKGAHVTVNNLAGWDNAVKATSYLAGGDAAYSMNNYIIFADGRNLPKDTPKNTLTIDIANLVDVDATKGQFGVTAWGRGATINVGGGRVLSQANPSQYSSSGMPVLSTAGATCELNFNVLKDAGGNVTGAGNNPVQIVGNVKTNTPFYGSGGVINLGLNTADSYLKGFTNTDGSTPLTEAVADMYTTGTINMWMGNGSQWINTGVSHVNKLVGGTTAGVLDMTDAAVGNVTIDNYSGNMVALYKHKNDGDEASDYSTANITISSATAGSTITLITDNSNIDTSDKVLTDKVLNALAGKLFYTAYTTGEENLSGVVQIAEGLTSASATLVTSEMMFMPSTGQGMVKAASSAVQITNDKTTNQEYVDLNILRDDDKYHFDKDFVVDVKGLTGKTNLVSAAYGANSLDLELADNTTLTLSASGSGKLFTIDAKNGLLVNGGTNSKLVLNLLSSANAYGGINMTAADNTKVATINTDVDISVKSSGTGFSGYALGIYASKGTMNINGKLTMKNGENPSVTNISGTEPDYFGWIDVYSTNGAVVNLKTVDIISGGEGLYANNAGSVINVDGGSIVHLKNNSKYYALRAAGATINVNMNGDKTAPANNNVVIKGNITTQSDWVNKSSDNTKDTVINLGLTTANSSLNGVAYNVFGNDGITNSGKTFKGYINMWLQNGATWTNENWSAGEAMKGTYGGEDFAGSHVAKLVGGSSAANSGIIFQKDANPLTIDSYSGNTKFIFSHNNSGTAITDYSAGDIIIKNAASGSNISLITDNQGINTSNTTVVDNVLGALARKLYYTAYVDGERNLSGSVGIAEGLTGSSATLFSDSFGYIAETGQGVYKDIVPPAEPVDPIPADVSSDVLTATMKDKAFLNDKITSSNNVVNYNLTDKAYSYHSLNAAPDSKAVIDVGGGNAIYFDGKTNRNLGIVLNDGANVTINGNVNVSSYSESYSAAGIAMVIGGTGIGKKTDLTINGKVTMGSADAPGVMAEDKHGAYGFYKGTRWTGAAINMNMGHGSTINITDGLTAYVDGHGIVTDPYYADPNYADKDLAVVNVNGNTNIVVSSSEDVGLYSLANFGGTINVNMQNGQPGTDKVYIHGNTMVMKDTMGAEDNPYFYRSGVINLALTTADSLWTGAVDNTGNTQAGEFNLYLQNGGTWKYENASKMDGLSAGTMPDPSFMFYGSYDGVSHITSLTGGENNIDAGEINIVSDDKIIVGSYSGNINVNYSNSGSSMSGGVMSIANADVASVITLIASNEGVTAENYQQVLNALAGQLYYTAGNENLIGKLKIDGTSYGGYIAFDGSGKGYFTTETNKTLAETPLGGLQDENFENVDVSGSGTARTYTMTNGIKVEVTTGSAIVTQNTNATNADVNVKNGNNLLVLVADQKTSPVIDASNGNVDINGAVRMKGQDGQKLINVGEGKKVVIDGAEMSNAVAGSGDGTVSNPAIDMKDGSSIYIGEYVNSSNEKVFSKRDVQFIGDVQNTRGSFNIALMTDKSYWDGDYQNEDAEFNIDINSHGAKWSGSANGDVINVNLTQGTWVNMGASSSTGNNFTLKGGGAGKAFLDMSNASSGNVTIDNYSGGMTIIYGHEAATPTIIPGGTVRIVNAASGSVINMMTLNAGIDMNDPDSILDTMDAVAHKLLYTNYASEGNIKGTVGIGEGLTRPTIVSHIADYKFDAESASIDSTTLRDTLAHGEIVYGDKETAMMRGAKMAMASTAMIWRAEANDLNKRMGDLQLRKEEAGVWAKYYSGRQEYNNNGSFSNKYKAVQVGVDKTLGHGWLGGIAFSYDDGSGSLNNGGSSDNKVQSLGFYGTKVNKNGEYIDLIGKFSRLENEYTVYNDYGYSLDGDYKNFGMSVSAEYGKHINLKNGLVLTPAVEFTLGRINSKNYDAYSEYYDKSMTVKQDAFNSAIGRIGISIGKEADRYSYYAKLGLAHEFAGGFDTTYSAPGEPTSGTSVDFKDTWKEVQFGGSVKLKNDALLYGSFSKSFGGDVKEKWRVDVGLMFTFNHISDFFGNCSNKGQKSDAEAVSVSNLTNQVQQVEAVASDITGTQVENDSVTVGDSMAVAQAKPVHSSGNTYVMDECIVTATKTKQRITDATADVSVVTRHEIEEMNITTVEEALRTVPGVQFNNYGGGNQMNGNLSSVRINGSKDIAILVDGVKINDFQGVGESGNMYAGVLNNMNNIERIEVLRGAAGVLYGSGAKGGVINIITREIQENKTIVDTSVGSFGRKDYKFNTMGKGGKMTYNIYQGTFKQGDITDGNGDKWEGHTKTKNFGTKITYAFNENNKLTFDYMDISSHFNGSDYVYSNKYDGKYDSTMWSVRDDWKINDNWSNVFVYRKNEEKRNYKQQYYAGYMLETSDTDYAYTFISDQVTFHNNRHNMVLGADYSYAKDKKMTGVKSNWDRNDIRNTSMYINEDWTIIPHVTLSGGIRRDHTNHENVDDHTSKSYKLAWDVTKKDTVYAGRSEYFILPSMDQMFDPVYGNKNLKPAEGRTESIGYNKKFDDNNFFTVNYFQTKEEVGIGWSGTTRINTSGVSRGWNAQYTSRLSDKWNFNLGWSHLFEKSSNDDSYSLGYYPRDLATFAFFYECGKFSGGIDGTWFFRKLDNSGRREFPVDNYGIYNLSLNYKPTKNMKLYCKIENIFNKFYAEHTNDGTDPYLTAGGERKYYAMPGRAFMVGLQFIF